jgi:hypothetical protein
MGRGMAREKFGRIRRKLDCIHDRQKPGLIGGQGKREHGKEIDNPYVADVGRVEIKIKRAKGFGKGGICQEIELTNSLSNRTAIFLRHLPEGREKIRQAVYKSFGTGLGILSILAGSAIMAWGIGIECVAQVNRVPLSVTYFSGLGGIFAGTGIVLAARGIAREVRNSFRSRMMKFIRDASNRDEVEALENIRI